MRCNAELCLSVGLGGPLHRVHCHVLRHSSSAVDGIAGFIFTCEGVLPQQGRALALFSPAMATFLSKMAFAAFQNSSSQRVCMDLLIDFVFTCYGTVLQLVRVDHATDCIWAVCIVGIAPAGYGILPIDDTSGQIVSPTLSSLAM